MARDMQSQKHQVTYRTYDNRAISRDAIEEALRSLEARQRNRERWERAKGWVVAGIVLAVLIAVFLAMIWWRLSTWA